jgi:FkbM family methyltransferase
MAINFSGVSRQSLVGRAIRWPLGLIPRRMPVRILSGPCRGMRWIAGAATHGAWLGSYELDKQRLFVEHVRRGDVIYDIGANVGVYTLLSSVLVGDAGHVYAFEPSPQNLDFLRAHVARNRLSNVTVIEQAVGAAVGTVKFTSNRGLMGRIDDHGDITVPVTSIDAFVAAGHRPPTLMKIDVEGAEADALIGAERTLRTHRPTLFLATHSFLATHLHEVHGRCVRFLQEIGYRVEPVDGQPLESSSELLARPA